MPLTRQQKKDLNITNLESYAIASEDLIDAKLEAFETCTNKLYALFVEFKLGRSPRPRRSQDGESSYHKENPPEKEEQATDSSCPRMRVDFPRWEGGDPTRWISRAEQYFCYHKILGASMVDIAIIHLERDAIQLYDWFEYTHRVPTWRQFKSGLLLRFGPSEYENIDGQFAKIRQTSTVQEYHTRFQRLSNQTRD
ncbi:hypothetical protein B296_00012215 [Ensete ventricosum]|uniref:Retrotransposon gag domain-containing protein n=1 Tax=Ensete ventricosum TaxID=4639 RepID=A0A426ZHP1_ENSVE|nr:hypothetical protein B296_00012215 [Ensete ventricosum]